LYRYRNTLSVRLNRSDNRKPSISKGSLSEHICEVRSELCCIFHVSAGLTLGCADDDDKMDGDDLAEMWGPPPQPVPVPRRQRKHSLHKIIAAARKAGADHVMVDGVKIALSPTAAVPTESNRNAFDQWKAKHAR
jgi:hypothetical protein